MTVRATALRAAGAVAVLAGTHQAITGVSGVLGSAEPPSGTQRNIDSELRFYGVWYGVAGAVMLRAAGDEETDRRVGGLLAIGWGAAPRRAPCQCNVSAARTTSFCAWAQWRLA